MTYLELYNKILEQKDLNREITVSFDFPLIPGINTFKLSSITDKGLTLRNETVARPLGHE